MKLKELREQKKLTQIQLAKNLNLNNVTYGRYEIGERQPDIQTLCQIADYYDVSLDYLCDHETKGNIDASNFSELKKGCLYILNKLSEDNTAIVFGYMTHVLHEQENR